MEEERRFRGTVRKVQCPGGLERRCAVRARVVTVKGRCWDAYEGMRVWSVASLDLSWVGDCARRGCMWRAKLEEKLAREAEKRTVSTHLGSSNPTRGLRGVGARLEENNRMVTAEFQGTRWRGTRRKMGNGKHRTGKRAAWQKIGSGYLEREMKVSGEIGSTEGTVSTQVAYLPDLEGSVVGARGVHSWWQTTTRRARET